MGLFVIFLDVDVKVSEGRCKFFCCFLLVVDLVFFFCCFFNMFCVWKVIFGDEDFLVNVFDEFFVVSLGKWIIIFFCFFWCKFFFFVFFFVLCLCFELLLLVIEGRKDCFWLLEFEYKIILWDNENIWLMLVNYMKFLWIKKY